MNVLGLLIRCQLGIEPQGNYRYPLSGTREQDCGVTKDNIAAEMRTGLLKYSPTQSCSRRYSSERLS